MKISDQNLNKFINSIGVGDNIDIRKPFVMIMYYPVTSEYGKGEIQIMNLLKALNKFDIKKFSFGLIQTRVTKIYQEVLESERKNKDNKTKFIKNLGQKYFYHFKKKHSVL